MYSLNNKEPRHRGTHLNGASTREDVVVLWVGQIFNHKVTGDWKYQTSERVFQGKENIIYVRIHFFFSMPANFKTNVKY